ncbi:UNVERIFIED_CONTAM: hypothetical protein GTU68_042172 [Idotea baltica]|nr:hypothetical protein [Idotea baltica]
MPFPDVVIVNSCIWDLTRWGAIQEEKYKEDIIMFFSKLRVLLPDDSLIIWNSTLPVSVNYTKGGLLVKQLEFVKYSLRFMVMEANKFTQQVCIAMGIDFLDLHYHMRFQLHRFD